MFIVFGFTPFGFAIVVGTSTESIRERDLARRLAEKGVRVEATVVETWEAESRGGLIPHGVRYRFVAGEENHENTYVFSGASLYPKEGETIEIYYDPEAPVVSMTRSGINGAKDQWPWGAFIGLLVFGSLPVGGFFGLRSLDTWKRGVLVPCRVVTKTPVKAGTWYTLEYEHGGKTWSRKALVAKNDPLRETAGKSWVLVNPARPGRIMPIPASFWNMGNDDGSAGLDRLFVWGAPVLAGFIGLFGLFMLGYGLYDAFRTRPLPSKATSVAPTDPAFAPDAAVSAPPASSAGASSPGTTGPGPGASNDRPEVVVVRAMVPDPLPESLAKAWIDAGGPPKGTYQGDWEGPALRAWAEACRAGRAGSWPSLSPAQKASLLEALGEGPFADARAVALAFLPDEFLRLQAALILAAPEAKGDVEIAKALRSAIQGVIDRFSSMSDPERTGWARVFAHSEAACDASNDDLLDRMTRDEHSAVRRLAGEVWYQRAANRVASGQVKEALAEYDRAISLVASFAQGHHARGLAKELLGDAEGALADYDAAIRFDEKFEEAYRARGLLHVARGDWNRAYDDIEQVRQLQRPLKDKYILVFKWMVLIRRILVHNAQTEVLGWSRIEPHDEWVDTILEFAEGKLTEEELLARAAHRDPEIARGRRCEATFYAAQVRIGNKELAEARRLLQECLDTRLEGFVEWRLAKPMLESLGE